MTGHELLTHHAITRATAARFIKNTLNGLERPMFGNDPQFYFASEPVRDRLIQQAAICEAGFNHYLAVKEVRGLDDGSLAYREAERDAMMLQLNEAERTEAQHRALEILESKEK